MKAVLFALGFLGTAGSLAYAIDPGAERTLLIAGVGLVASAFSYAGLWSIMKRDSAHTARSLASAESNYRRLFDHNPQPMWILDASHRNFLAVNDAAVHHYGYTRDEFLNMTFYDLLASGRDVVLRCALPPVGPVRLCTASHVRKDGSIISVELTCSDVDFEGAPAKLVSVKDVSKRVAAERAQAHAEDAVRQSQRRLFDLFENTTYGVYRSRADGTIVDANPAMVAMLGYDSKAELLERNLTTDIYADPEERRKIWAQAGQADHLDREVKWKRKNGECITVRLSGRMRRPDESAAGECEVIVDNITERKNLEEQFHQAQKMEAVGQLAGGVAHDFNNLLGVVIGYSDLVLQEKSLDERSSKRIGEIKRAGQRAADLAKQLLSFSRRHVPETRVVDLNSAIDEVRSLLARLLGEHIELDIRKHPEPVCIKVDPIQIEQVLMNLVVNARDAMPHGGKLTIASDILSSAGTLPTGYRLRGLLGKYARLVVTDTGHGMSDAVKGRIFEPFFTTKAPGIGTGLGLSTVYGIVQNAGGEISVFSEPEKGASFEILIPLYEKKPSEEPSRPTTTSPTTGTETVLLVEDEESLRELDRDLLQSMGYSVICATDGVEALELAAQHPGTIHALITDVVMPRMNGRRLSEKLRQQRPGVKVIFMSGYTDNVIFHQDIEKADAAFLQKPVPPDLLAKTLRELLDGTATQGSSQEVVVQ